jgi:hypothetical protein
MVVCCCEFGMRGTIGCSRQCTPKVSLYLPLLFADYGSFLGYDQYIELVFYFCNFFLSLFAFLVFLLYTSRALGLHPFYLAFLLIRFVCLKNEIVKQDNLTRML